MAPYDDKLEKLISPVFSEHSDFKKAEELVKTLCSMVMNRYANLVKIRFEDAKATAICKNLLKLEVSRCLSIKASPPLTTAY
ncbi:hypothetical protein LTR49_018368 [Elasticomyces elasticus]|nr:hypothetical protein LTR49_018368 [Elasticomyces elasticus]KAK5749017.1 hypothetical protein LTS12_020915 [Elasticomyces elasticus]